MATADNAVVRDERGVERRKSEMRHTVSRSRYPRRRQGADRAPARWLLVVSGSASRVPLAVSGVNHRAPTVASRARPHSLHVLTRPHYSLVSLGVLGGLNCTVSVVQEDFVSFREGTWKD